MKNITVSVDEETHRQARIRAAELGTSVSALVRGYLREICATPAEAAEADGQSAETEKERRRRRMREVIDEITANGGGLLMSENLPREALYDRDALR